MVGGAKHDEANESNDKDQAYFQYYALLSHQAQMLQDNVRTSSYQKAILSNGLTCFKDKVIIDVGAGNGILSLFAAQAGARKVFAIEASNMVERLQHLINAVSPSSSRPGTNVWLGDRVVPVRSKMEDVTASTLQDNKKCDTIVSECLGVLLVHERMCESFLDARDRFLKPGGSMFPSSGTICLSPIEDKLVWEEAANKARFWDNQNFYGVDVSPFLEAAWEESFSSPVVGCFGPLIVLAPSNDYNIDFQTISQEQLKRFTIPLSFEISQAAVIHGLGGWFDLHFFSSSSDAAAGTHDFEMSTNEPITDASLNMAAMSSIEEIAGLTDPVVGGVLGNTTSDPSVSSSYMSTSPFSTPTHWQQVRFLLREPLAVNKGQRIVGSVLCEANDFRSYTLTASLRIDGTSDDVYSRKCQWRLDRQVYSWTSSAPAPQ